MKEFSLKRILVAVDMSKPSLAALEAAKGLVRGRAVLDVVYVQDLPVSLLGLGPDGEAGTARELGRQMDEFRRWREERLRKATEEMPRSSVRVRTIRGWPPSALAQLAQTRGVDLVVMGTHGYAGLDRVFFGSVAEAVVRKATSPVLTVHELNKPLRVRSILVPFNGQPYARESLVYAKKLARSCGARLTALYVEEHGLHDAKLTGALRDQVGRARFTVRVGDVPHEIIREAAEKNHDLIVLSAHRRRFWSDFVLGTTAERVLRHSPVPVLSVPSAARGSRAACRAS